MATLSDVEIFQAALQAGFTPDQAVTMTAIALAESGGRTTALNSTGEHSVGLWQINTAVHDWDPSVAEDPVANARMAFEVSGGGADITRWTVTHETKGARYLSFRSRAEQAAAAAGHADATGQWDAPADYYATGVGAAPADSTSVAEHLPGEIPTTVAAVAPDTGDPDPSPPSPFDNDGDGVFDAVEAFLGEDLVAGQSTSADSSPQHEHSHSPDPGIDPDDLVNGQVASEHLADAVGGSDSLLAGAPTNSWNAMAAAAAADGIDITYSDAYRPLHDQHRMVEQYGLYSQGGRAAAPGHSNHGLGLAVDVNVRGRPEVKGWLEAHAHEYGWEANVRGEPWHYEYDEDLDPDPDRGGASADDEADAPTSVFDRDGDGVFDSVEAWLGTDVVTDVAHDDAGVHAHEHAADHSHDRQVTDHDHDHGPGLCDCDHSGDSGDEASPVVDPELDLPPIEPAVDDALAAVLAHVDLDPSGSIVVDDLSNNVRAELERALADLAASRTGVEVDLHEFSHQFEHVLEVNDGVLDTDVLGDLTDMFGLDDH